MGGTDAHREVVVQLPLRDGVASRVEHVVVCDVVLSGGLRDAHEMTRYLVRVNLSRNLVKRTRTRKSPKTANRPQLARKRL